MLVKAISNELNVPMQDVSIKSFDVSGGSAIGDNYACTMKATRIDALVKGKEETFHYIAKCVPTSDFRANLITKVSKKAKVIIKWI